MIKVTNTQFIQNPSHIQHLAEQEPVLVENGDKTQVLMDYEQYAQLSGENPDKPFVSLYDAFSQIASEFSDEEREILANVDDEADFSFAYQG